MVAAVRSESDQAVRLELSEMQRFQNHTALCCQVWRGFQSAAGFQASIRCAGLCLFGLNVPIFFASEGQPDAQGEPACIAGLGDQLWGPYGICGPSCLGEPFDACVLMRYACFPFPPLYVKKLSQVQFLTSSVQLS